jgi:Xaa-Pro aminopeptidase
MAYFSTQEYGSRVAKVREILEPKKLDFALIYYDEFNLANAWYLTGWCPQFESGSVLVPLKGEPLILGGPESEPFAKMDCAITQTRNLPVFMVPDEEYPNAAIMSFAELFKELRGSGPVKRAGIVGAGQMPMSVYRQIEESFRGVEMVDITEEYLRLRYIKSPWELAQMRQAFRLADDSCEAMLKAVRPGAHEYEVAAVGEFEARRRGANNFGFKAIVGSGKRSNAVVPTAGDKVMEAGEMVMLGLAPRVNGYAGVFGHTVPVSGEATKAQAECLKHLREVVSLTKEKLVPGTVGREVDAPGRKYFIDHGFMKYLVCPFAHTIGINEAEAPFFGPHSSDVVQPGMAISVDVSFFGHPVLNGVRIETAYQITEGGPVPFSPTMDKLLSREE